MEISWYLYLKTREKRSIVKANNILNLTNMDNKNKTKFTQWGQLLECKTLKASQRVILGIILNLHNLDDWDFTPLSVLEEKSGIGLTSLKENISILCQLELLEKVPNHNRKKSGKAPNDYVPNYTKILDLLNNQIVGKRPFKDNQIVGKRPFNRSENDHSNSRKTTIRIKEEKKEKNKASIYNNNNLSTRRYMVYSGNENENKQNTNDMNIIINETENGNPINALLGFEKADERGWDSSSNVETATADSKSTLNGYAAGNNNTNSTETDTDNPNVALLGFDKAFEKGWDSSTDVEETAARNNKSNNTEADPTAADTENTQNKAHSEVFRPQVDNYTTAVEKTPQERYLEGNLETETADDETDSPNNGANTAAATNTLSIEDTQRIMSQAAQNILKNRKHAVETDEDNPYKSTRDKIYKAFNASNGANTAADAQKAPKNDRDEEIIPQVDNYTTHIEKTPQERYFDNMGADTAATTENGADTADTRPIYNTIHAADEWIIRNAEDTCWQETLEHVTTNLANPSENEIRTLLNKTYGDWKNHDKSINAKMITDMKKYVEYKYQICLDKKEKRDTVTCQNPKSDAYPTVAEIENLDLCHISKNRDILNRLSAGCTRLDTVILSLNKAIEFTQIYRIATPQLYQCISNAMATINNYPTVSDKKAKYIKDLATHLCDMLDKVC